MLKQRVVTGIMYVGFILWMIFSLPARGFDLALAIVSCFAMAEWFTLIQIKRAWVRMLLLDVYILTLTCIFWFQPLHGLILWIGVFAWACMLPFLIWQQARETFTVMKTPVWVVLGMLLMLAMYTGMTDLMSHSGRLYVLMLFLIPWVADTAAYAVGIFTGGKHKLIPRISPAKSWEGLMGGFVISMIVLPLYACVVLGKNQVSIFFFIAMLCLVTASVLGDLFESYAKRVFGVKDSGNLLPGHGGLLDRIDSLMAVSPCFMIAVQLGWI